MDAVSWILLAAYASLVLELVVVAVPSEASARNLLRDADPMAAAAAGVGAGGLLGAARARSRSAKVLAYALPTALGVALFLAPLAAIFAPAVLDPLLPIRALQTPAVAWLGIGLVLIGRATTLAAALQLRRGAASALQADGVFGISRNPIVLGMHALYLGACLVFPCVVLLVGFAPHALNMHRRVRIEEDHLERRFGASYRAYADRVPRYLLF